MEHRQFHIQYFPPNANWPQGGYALYMIDGDEIAKRIIFDHSTGELLERSPWPGYIGCYVTMALVAAEIEAMCKPA